jgi:DNA-binding CsgD family transcriptional regulator
VLQEEGLAGRGAELAVVRSALSSDRPRVLLIAGEAGIGKTRLLRGALTAEVETQALTAACLPLTQAAPLLPVGDLLRSALGVDGGQWFDRALATGSPYLRGTLGALVPQIAGVTDISAHPEDDAWMRQRLLTAVREAWALLASARRAAVVIEDLHWADPSTRDLLDYVITGGQEPPISVVATYRLGDPDVPNSITSWFARLQRGPGVEVLEVGPLSREQTDEQLRLLTGTTPEEEVAADIFRRSGGNPLVTEQLAGAGAGPDIPDDLRAAVEAKLLAVDDAAVLVARTLAIVGKPLTIDQLGELTGLMPLDVEASVRALGRWRLVHVGGRDEPVRVRHALVAEVVAQAVPAAEAATFHRRAADVMSRWQGVGLAGEIATHWRAVSSARDELVWLTKAADEASELNAAAEAAGYWRRAIALWDRVPDAAVAARRSLAEIYLAADDALWAAADVDAERTLAEEALVRLAEPTPHVRTLLLRGVARARSLSDPDAAIATIGQALALLSDEPVTTDVVVLHAEAAAYHRLQGHYDAYAAEIANGLAACEICGNQDWVPRLLIQRAWYQMSVGELEAALSTIETGVLTRPLSMRDETVARVFQSDILLKGGRYEAVVTGTAATLHALEARGMNTAVAALVLRSNCAEALLALGRGEPALEMLVPGTNGRPTNATRPLHQLRAEAETAAGRLDEALTRLSTVLSLASEETEFRIDVMRSWAEAALWAHTPGPVARDLAEALRAIADRDISRFQDWSCALLARAAADRAEANQESPAQRARTIAELRDLLASLSTNPLAQPSVPATSRAARATWDAELSRIDNSSDPDQWGAAADAWHELSMPFRSGYCRWRQGEALLGTRGAGVRERAATILREALTASSGHHPLAAAIRETARQARLALDAATPVAESPSERSLLTERELHVLQLLAHGLSNAEIGAALYMSPKTASVHVTHILRKLGVKTRTHATTVALRAGLIDQP